MKIVTANYRLGYENKRCLSTKSCDLYLKKAPTNMTQIDRPSPCYLCRALFCIDVAIQDIGVFYASCSAARIVLFCVATPHIVLRCSVWPLSRSQTISGGSSRAIKCRDLFTET
eukprot:1439640-Rhodomonas_salina.1